MSSTEIHKRKKFYPRPLPSRNVVPGGRTGWIVWGFHGAIYRWQHIYQKQVSVFSVTNNHKIHLPVSVERNSRYRNNLGIGNLSLSFSIDVYVIFCMKRYASSTHCLYFDYFLIFFVHVLFCGFICNSLVFWLHL